MKNYLLKTSAAGNRFVLVDKKWFGNIPFKDWQIHSYPTQKKFSSFLNLKNLSLSERKIFIDQLLSCKELSLAEGLVILKYSSHLVCDFYNKDGSLAEMCGNAASCISTYMAEINSSFSSFRLGQETVHTIQNSKGQWGISFKNTPQVEGSYIFEINGEKHLYHFISPGVPHAVIEYSFNSNQLNFLDKKKLKTIAQTLRFKNPKNKNGMNISFFQVERPGYLKAITYERGVEDFTLACGTGAVAVAFTYLHKYKTNSKNLFIKMPGGILEVQVSDFPALFSPVKMGF